MRYSPLPRQHSLQTIHEGIYQVWGFLVARRYAREFEDGTPFTCRDNAAMGGHNTEKARTIQPCLNVSLIPTMNSVP